MNEPYLLMMRPAAQARVRQLADAARRDPDGKAARALAKTLDAIEALRWGEEADHKGERLGYSPFHFDLRDCAEIKLALVQELKRDGTPRGASHRIIYREFEPLAGDSRPIRELVGFGRRAGGAVFDQTATELERRRGVAVDSLQDLENVVPAVGANKNPGRPISPVRLPLPPDVAIAVQAIIHRNRAPVLPAATKTSSVRDRVVSVHSRGPVNAHLRRDRP